MEEQAWIFLTHVAAQIAGRWLPPPVLGRFDLTLQPGDWLDWGEIEWKNLCTAAQAVMPRYQELFACSDKIARHAAAHLQAVKSAGAAILLYGTPDYPPRLGAISDPPLVLTVLGCRELFKRPMVSVVGSRKASGLAVRESFHLGVRLAERGVAVVSGGAFGCDIAAHLGVLEAQRVHVASGFDSPAPASGIVVFAGGLEKLYPRTHTGIFRRLLACGGALVSERLWAAPSRPYDFPARNRIISGLAPVTAVMQAALKSGAQITARQALDQGRDVLVLYHPPGDVRASGSQHLLAEGAIGFTSAAAFVEFSNTLS